MPTHSSTSNSKRLLWQSPLTWSILFITVFFCGDWMLRQSEYYRFRFGNRLGNAITVLKNHTGDSGNNDHVIAFLGTSKMHSAIDPDTIEKYFPGKNCLNLSLNSMTFWEMLKLLQYSKASGSKIDLLVCEVAPFMFNVNCLNPATRRVLDNELQLDIWCNKDDIVHQDTTLKSLDLIKKKICGPWRLEDIFSALKNVVPEELPPPVYHLDLDLEKRLAARQAFSPEAAADAHCNEFEFSKYNVYCFKELIAYCMANKIKLVLLELPSHKDYTRFVFNNMPADKVAAYQQLLDESKVKVIAVRDSSNYELDDSIFVDYAHFSNAGKIKFSEKIGKLLQAM